MSDLENEELETQEAEAEAEVAPEPEAEVQAHSDEQLEEVAQAVEKEPKEKAKSNAPFLMEAIPFVSAVEAILFAAERPASFDRLREAFGDPCPNNDQLQVAIDQIQARYAEPDRGFMLRKAQGGYHFVTKVENAEFIRRFQASKPFRLGRSALEVLSIIAYRQPITRAEIDQVRGIDSSHLLRTLIERGLVRMAGKAEVPGRPVQYGTTHKFLEVIGLASTAELPPLSELRQLEGDTEDPQKRMEEGLDKFLAPMKGSAGAGEEAALDDGTDPMLGEIDSMIQNADHAPKEVYASALHREIAEANQEALEAFQAANRRRPRKKEAAAEPPKAVTFEELTGGSDPDSNPAN